MKILLLLLASVGCEIEARKPDSQYAFTNEQIGIGAISMRRVENKEVVCYIYGNDSLSCKWKNEK